MEPKVRRPRGRPRKRRREDEEGAKADPKSGPENKKRAVETVPKAYVGRYVLKEFNNNGIYLGKIVYYDTGLYRVEYEDGDSEDLESHELRVIVLDEIYFDDDLCKRRKKLDERVLKNSVKRDELKKKNAPMKDAGKAEVSTLSGGPNIDNDSAHGDVDADLSNDSCESTCDEDLASESTALLPPPPPLPPSSGSIGVSEEYVSLLFSVYGFLRSFSISLYLSPFGLNDFVGSINCRVPNTLLDAIHVALMRPLKNHLETLSSDGCELAVKCLRSADWSLLDTLTWPVYLVQYLTIMGYLKDSSWRGIYDDILDRNCYQLPAGRKLMILQILCDDVLQALELRAEIDMRQESEVGIDIDEAVANPSDSMPRRVHPRYSKTSACKDRETMEVIAGSCEVKQPAKIEANVDIDVDQNNDECRLCGMDGTLLCCDGCPSAYHSRCIGVMKMFLPEGPWYCPECTLNQTEPPTTKGTSLSGAITFGIDPYGQAFLGTRNHLLVFSVFSDAGSCTRYYNQNDIPRVLQALYSSVQNIALYSEICKSIVQYWNIPDNVIRPLQMIEVQKDILKENAVSPAPPPYGSNNSNVLDKNGDENTTGIDGSNVYNVVAVPCPETSDTETQVKRPCQQSLVDTTISQDIKPHDMKKLGPALSISSAGHQAGQLASSCISLLTMISSQSREGNLAGLGSGDSHSADGFTYMGTSFKPQAYINNYVHGDFAASAAAKLAVLLSEEESKFSEVHASGSSKKASSITFLQSKAFSLTASRFFWPSSDKKLMEVPRERCGWCYSCKAPVQSRRGCMLNNAALNATKSAMKVLPGLRPIKDIEGSIPRIGTYILYMEESLHGLVVGPFLSSSYRKQWCKQVECASSVMELKAPLLELEEHIRLITLSGEWVKPVDNWFSESPLAQSIASTMGTMQTTRGPGRKRTRKQSALSEITDAGNDRISELQLGGKRPRHVYQKATLSCLTLKELFAEDGSRKITGICYTDSTAIPRRTKQHIWRAAVDTSRNAAQLALQVRYLDLHVRWSDLVRPDQNFQDGKGQETEASVFRNARISAKRIVGNKVQYGVTFGTQKHLPSRVMKNIIEIDQSQDGNEQYWFLETCVPLYLIKEFEVSVQEVLPPAENSVSQLSGLQKMQLKASRIDIFSYLVCKRDKVHKFPCVGCQLQVSLRNAVKCSDCQGYCHEGCASTFTSGEANFVVNCKHCYHNKAKSNAQREKGDQCPTTPLPLQGKEYHNAASVLKVTKPKCHNKPLTSVKTQESCSETKSSSGLEAKSRSNKLTWGLIWKKKNNEDTGTEFRLKNILLKGNQEIHWLRPICILCEKPYSSDLMYVRCETCKNWYHAEALELEESRIFDVQGFKCCKCRRIKSPICPYEDPESKRRRKKPVKQGSTATESDSGIISESKEYEAATPMFPTEEAFTQDEDPLLSCLPSGNKLIPEPNSELDFDWNAGHSSGVKKLPVRRHIKREGDTDECFGNEFSHSDRFVHLGTVEPFNSARNASFPQAESADGLAGMQIQSSPPAEWDVSGNGLEGEVLFDCGNLNYENMVYEPHTYFSFDELLNGVTDESQDAGNLDGMSSAVSHGIPGESGVDPPNFVEAGNIVFCKICLQTEPLPDLFCQLCGLQIHSHCSLWLDSSCKDGWTCGNCRESR